MKTLVAYLSKTGNTKKVAQAIFGELEGEKDIQPIGKVESAAGYDVVFLGFPVQGEGPDPNTVKLLEKHCVPGRKVALFITHASPEDAPELPQALEKFYTAAGRADIVGKFDCQGQLAGLIKIIMSIMPNPKYRQWARQDNSHGQPDEGRLNRARSFARSIMQKLAAQSTCVQSRIPVPVS